MAPTYSIYTTRALERSLDPLVTQKRNKGYTVELRFVEDLTYPVVDAIREQVLKDRPDFLLLVGDNWTVPGYPCYDRHLSPPIRFDSDAYYSVPKNARVPTVATGRISSDDPDTVRRVCETLVAYPADLSSRWRQTVVLTGWIPREPGDPNYPKDAAVECLREAAHYLTCRFEFEKSGIADRDRRWHADDSTVQGLINRINSGAAIVRYLGHGNSGSWGNIGQNENFTCRDMDRVHTGARLPLVLSLTCGTGDLAASPSLAEKWQETCKAIGVWASDAVADSYFLDRVSQAILHEIVTVRERCIGRILLRALAQVQRYAYQAPSVEHFLKTTWMFRYLGDPDTALAIPEPRRAARSEWSTNGPALAASNDTLLVGWTGAPSGANLKFIRSTDGLDFSNRVTLAETSPNAPALCNFDGEFVVAWTGVGNHLINIMRSADGEHWDDKITLNEKSWSAPALARFGGMLYLAWRGGPTNNRINILRSSDARTWQDKKVLDWTTTSGPALTATLSNLILAWRGGPTNNLLNIAISSDGRTFRSKQTLADATTSEPALTNYIGRPMLAWAGVGNRLLNVIEGHENRDYNDTTWGAKITWPEKCVGAPALAKLGMDLVCAWTDADGKVNTMLYPVAL